MSVRLKLIFPLFPVLLLAQAVEGQASSSPFILPVEEATSAPEQGPASIDSIVLTGLIRVGDAVDACLLDVRSSRSFWITVGESQGEMSAVEFDALKDAVLIRFGGSSRWLPLRKAQIRDLPVMRTADGAVDWVHMNLTEKEKAREAELMMWDILEVGRLARAGKVPRSPKPP